MTQSSISDLPTCINSEYLHAAAAVLQHYNRLTPTQLKIVMFIRRYMDEHGRPAPTVEIACHVYGIRANDDDLLNLRQQIHQANKELADLGERVRGIRNVGYTWEALWPPK